MGLAVVGKELVNSIPGNLIEHVDDVQEEEGSVWCLVRLNGAINVLVELGLGRVEKEVSRAVEHQTGGSRVSLG
jgi:hypothetical protein